MKAILAALLLLIPYAAAAHSVPDDVKVRVFLKPQANHLSVLVRMPANALIDILFPVLPGSGALDLTQIDGYAAAGAQVWIADLLSIYEDGRALPPPRILATQVSRLSDPSFSTYEGALKHVQGPRLPPATLLSQDDAAIDALLEIPIQSPAAAFTFEPRFARLGVRVVTTLTFLPGSGGVRQYIYEGDPEAFQLDPSWHQAFAHFMKVGVDSVFSGTAVAMFLFCLAVILRSSFVAIFAAAEACSTVGCSVFQIPATAEFVTLSVMLVAAVTVYMAIEIIVSRKRRPLLWPMAAAAGLIFGFSAWQQFEPMIQYSGTHRLMALAALNFGLIGAELLVLAIFAGTLPFVLRIPKSPRTAVVVAVAIVIRVCWHRMTDNAHVLGAISGDSPAAIRALVLLAILLLGAELWRTHLSVPPDG